MDYTTDRQRLFSGKHDMKMKPSMLSVMQPDKDGNSPLRLMTKATRSVFDEDASLSTRKEVCDDGVISTADVSSSAEPNFMNFRLKYNESTFGVLPKQNGGIIGINPKKNFSFNDNNIVGPISPRPSGIGNGLGQPPDKPVGLNYPQSHCQQHLKRPCESHDDMELDQYSGLIPANKTDQQIDATAKVLRVTEDFNQDPQNTEDHVILEPQELNLKLIKNSSSPVINKEITIEHGSFGTVHSLSEKVVVKTMKIHETKVYKVDSNEVLIPHKLQHNGIIRIFGIACVNREFKVFMENGGKSLQSMMRDLPFRNYIRHHITEFCTQLYATIMFLEKHSVAHRDVKPGNLTVQKIMKNQVHYVSKLIDFGSAQVKQYQPAYSAHTIEFLPPTLVHLIMVLKNSPYKTEKMRDPGQKFFEENADCYATSLIVLWLSMGGNHPIEEVNQYRQADLEKQRPAVAEKIVNLSEDHYEPFIVKLPEPLATCVRNSLLRNHEKRWSATRICKYLDQYNAGSVAKKAKMTEELVKLLNVRENEVTLVQPANNRSPEMDITETDIPTGMNIRSKGNLSVLEYQDVKPNNFTVLQNPKQRDERLRRVSQPYQTGNIPWMEKINDGGFSKPFKTNARNEMGLFTTNASQEAEERRAQLPQQQQLQQHHHHCQIPRQRQQPVAPMEDEDGVVGLGMHPPPGDEDGVVGLGMHPPPGDDEKIEKPVAAATNGQLPNFEMFDTSNDNKKKSRRKVCSAKRKTKNN